MMEGTQQPASRQIWEDFRRSRLKRRRQFERRHPAMRRVRWLGAGAVLASLLGLVMVFLGILPRDWGGYGGALAILYGSILVAFVGLTYRGWVRWREDRDLD